MAMISESGVWMRGNSTHSNPHAFISSTVLDLPEHLTAAISACSQVGITPVVLEAPTQTQVKNCIENADLYIGILTFNYGVVPFGQEKSISEIEYDYATEKGLPCLIFQMSDEHRVRARDIEVGENAEKLKIFKSLVRQMHPVREFHSANELKAALVISLVDMQREPSRPNRALLLFPNDEAFWRIQSVVSEQLESEGIQVSILAETTSELNRYNMIYDAIQSADLVVIDVSSWDPNIMYELGYIHAVRKPAIMLANSDAMSSLPSDLHGFIFLPYDKNDTSSLKGLLTYHLRRYTKEEWR